MEEQKDFKDEESREGMAYYCKLCGCWHYPGSDIHLKHKIYASQKTKPKKVVRRSPTKRWKI